MPNPRYPFNSHRTYCCWCGTEVAQKPFLTRRVLNMMQDNESQYVVECEKHHAVGEQLERKKQEWMAGERAKFETVLAEQLPNMTAAFRAELLGESIPEPAVAQGRPRGRPRRPAGAIPIPDDSQVH